MDQEGGEMAVPLSTTYGGVGHMIHHNHHHHDPSSAQILPSNNNNGPQLEDHVPFKRPVRYRECLKNHAAAMGGSATDGCGEFMPSGAEGTLEALTCSACNCHRNFHRKETDGDSSSSCHCFKNVLGRKLLGYPIPSRAAAPPPHHHHPMILSYNNGGGSIPSESDDQAEDGGGMAVGHHHRPEMVKKRFRTKFTPEQKEKMLSFAEKVGWKIQKQEENVVQQFCQEVGVKRRVLKVWMHNNKHSLAKRSINNMNINNSVPNIMQQISSPPQNHHVQNNNQV